jgi:hypothetical protein
MHQGQGAQHLGTSWEPAKPRLTSPVAGFCYSLVQRRGLGTMPPP